jgi:hypothetical protein
VKFLKTEDEENVKTSHRRNSLQGSSNKNTLTSQQNQCEPEHNELTLNCSKKMSISLKFHSKQKYPSKEKILRDISR